MTPVIGRGVRMAGGPCAPDDRGGGWGQAMSCILPLDTRAQLNQALQPTASSVRSCLASASSGG
jgi:hypothetical protein